MAAGKVDIITVGYVTRDEIAEIYKNGERSSYKKPGGVSTYFSTTASCIGDRVGIVSRIGEDFNTPFFDLLRQTKNADLGGLKVVDNKNSEIFVLNLHDRYTIGVIIHRLGDIMPEDIPKPYLKARGVHIGPLVGEVPLKTVKYIREKNPKAVISLDAQGYIRKLKSIHAVSNQEIEKLKGEGLTEADISAWKAGDVEIVDLGSWEGFDSFLKYVDILKMNMFEAEKIVGSFLYELMGKDESTDPNFYMGKLEEEAKITNSDAIFIITLAEKGALISFKKGNKRKRLLMEAAPVLVKKPEDMDTTGGGDSYSAAFLSEYSKSRDVLKAAEFARVVCAMKCEIKGPMHGLEMKDFKKRMKETPPKKPLKIY